MNANDAARAMIGGKEVLDEDGDRFRYNPELRVFELFYKNSYWIFWCKGPRLDCFEHEGGFRYAPEFKSPKQVKGPGKEQSVFGLSEPELRVTPRVSYDGNGTPVEA